MDSIVEDALREGSISNAYDNLTRDVKQVFDYLENSEDLNSNSPLDFEEKLLEGISNSEDYEMNDVYEIGESIIYEIRNTSEDLTGIIRLSYNDKGHLNAETRIE